MSIPEGRNEEFEKVYDVPMEYPLRKSYGLVKVIGAMAAPVESSYTYMIVPSSFQTNAGPYPETGYVASSDIVVTSQAVEKAN